MEYIQLDKLLYKIEMSVLSDDDIFIATKNKDGSINFTAKHYNGECSFGEAIEKSYRSMEKL